MKIDFLAPHVSQYGVLHHFTKKLYEAARRYGIASRFLEGESRHEIPLSDPPDLLVGFNGIYKEPSGQLISDKIHTPFLTILVDPPFRFYPLTASPYTLIACDDRESCRMLKKTGFENTFFLPHGVEKELITTPSEKPSYDVVMLNTCIDYKGRRKKWEKIFPEGIPSVMETAAELTFEKESLSFISAFEIALNERVSTGGKTYLDSLNLFQILEELELYIKGKERTELIQVLDGVNIHLFGGSLDGAKWEAGSHITCHDPVPYMEALQIIHSSKIVLSGNCKNKYGAHERIFSSLALGALPVTNRTPFIQEIFSDEIVQYNPTKLESLNETLQDLLHHESKRRSLVQKAQEATLSAHTWDHRVETLINNVKALYPL